MIPTHTFPRVTTDSFSSYPERSRHGIVCCFTEFPRTRMCCHILLYMTSFFCIQKSLPIVLLDNVKRRNLLFECCVNFIGVGCLVENKVIVFVIFVLADGPELEMGLVITV